MGQRVVGELRQRTRVLLHHVVGGRLPFGHHGAGEVGDGAEQLVALLLGLCELLGNDALRLLEGSHAGAGLGGLLFLPLFHQGADGGGDAVELGGFVVILQLQLTAAVVKGYYPCYGLGSVQAFHGQTCHNLFGVGFYLLKCKHF